MTWYNFIIGYRNDQQQEYDWAVDMLRDKMVRGLRISSSRDSFNMAQHAVDCSIRKKDRLRAEIKDLGLTVVVSDKVQTKEEMQKRAERFSRK